MRATVDRARRAAEHRARELEAENAVRALGVAILCSIVLGVVVAAGIAGIVLLAPTGTESP